MPYGMLADKCPIAIKKTFRYKERDLAKRITYLRALRAIIKAGGKDKLVYIDESGFESSTHRTHGWGLIGKKLYGERSGNTRPRTSLIAGKCGKKLLSTMLFEGSTDSILFNEWLKNHLLNEIPPNSIIIMDNAAFHKTARTKQIIEEARHSLLYLPPYSPDFNPIENDFANIKKRRRFAPPNSSLDDVIKSYGIYLE